MTVRDLKTYSIFQRFQAWMPLVVLLLLSNGCGTPSATFGNQVQIKDFQWRETDLNIEESGWNFEFALTIRDLKNKSVPVRIFSADGTELMGESIAIPPYESTEWKEFSIFVPTSKTSSIREVNGSANIYAVSPSDPAVYLGSITFTWDRYRHAPSVWKLKGIEFDVDIRGTKGIKVTLDLEINNREGERLEIIPLLNGVSIPTELELTTIEFLTKINSPISHKYGIYRDLTLNIPYDALDRLVSASDQETIIIGPGIRYNGQIEPGNIRLRLPPAGTFDRQVDGVSKKLKSIQENIDYLEKQSEILSKGR